MITNYSICILPSGLFKSPVRTTVHRMKDQMSLKTDTKHSITLVNIVARRYSTSPIFISIQNKNNIDVAQQHILDLLLYVETNHPELIYS